MGIKRTTHNSVYLSFYKDLPDNSNSKSSFLAAIGFESILVERNLLLASPK